MTKKQLKIERAFLLKKNIQDKLNKIIESCQIYALVHQGEFYAKIDHCVHQIALLYKKLETDSTDTLDSTLERLNTEIASIQFYSEVSNPESELFCFKRLHLSFLTRITWEFIENNIHHLEKIQGLYLNSKHKDDPNENLEHAIVKIANNINKLTELQILYARFNRLSCIPTGIGALKNLKELGLESNCIKSIPDISKMESLEELSLDSNNIKQIPKFIKSLKELKILSLDSNQIRKIPEFLFEQSKLQILGLNHNNLLRLYNKNKSERLRGKNMCPEVTAKNCKSFNLYY